MGLEPISEQMRGRWQGVLPSLGVPSGFLSGKHQPCPMCGGKDRARFDDKNGTGTWICSHCGAGDGVALVMKLNGWDFRTAVDRLRALAGDVRPRAPKPKEDAKKQLSAMRKVWGEAKSPAPGDAVNRYLRARGITIHPIDIRQSSQYDMIAVVRDSDGCGCQIHRTLLTADGKKADVDQPRLFMPGLIPKGAAVRLMQSAGSRLGIAEGIETALSAAMLFEMPVWAALNTSMLKAWNPPSGVTHVVIYGDNDANFAGQAAAYELARRIVTNVSVTVETPDSVGCDWNDIMRRQRDAD